MKRFKRAAACLVMTSMLFTLFPLSGCGKKKNTPMGSNEVVTDESPWYDIEKNVLEKNYDPSELEYAWSELIGLTADKVVMYTNGNYPLPDDFDWDSEEYPDTSFYQIDVYSVDGVIETSFDLKDTVNCSDAFDTIDPAELEETYNFSASGFGVGAPGIPSKAENDDEDEGSEDPEDAEDIEEDEDISEDENQETDGEGSDDVRIADPRACWYMDSVDLGDDDTLSVKIFCYVGTGHEYRFTIDLDTGDVISWEELENRADVTFEDASSEGTTQIEDYSIEKFWIYDWEGEGDPSYILVITAPDGSTTTFDLREEMPDLPIYDIPTFMNLGDHQVLFRMSIQGETEDRYALIDLDNMTIEDYSEDMDWITVDLWNLSYVEGIGNIVLGEEGLILLDFDNKEESVIFDYNWCNINRYDIQSLQLISYSEDELVFAGSVWQGGYGYYFDGDTSETQILKLTKADKNPNSGKTILVAATTQYLNYTMCEAICMFNEENTDYYITINNEYSMDKYIDYSEMENEDDYQEGFLNASSELTDQLAIDLMAGEGPDIILDATSFYQLNNEDYLLDISDRLPTDGYFTNVFDACKIDDKIYQVPLTFALNGIITRESYVDAGQTGFTFDQYAEFVDDVCNGKDPMAGTQLDFFIDCFTASNDQFMSNGQVDYNNEAFIALAEYVKDNVIDVVVNEDEYYSGAYYEDEEEAPAEYYTYASFRAMTDSFARYDDAIILGIPSYDGRGPLISVDSSVAISAQTQEPDACWQFVQLLLSEDVQTMYGESDYCTPVNINAFENTGHAVIDDYNRYVQDQLRWASEAEIRAYGLYELDYSCIDRFQELIENCSQVASQDSAVITIVREEMPAYFSGQKDIDEVIEVMEDRVQTFINERG